MAETTETSLAELTSEPAQTPAGSAPEKRKKSGLYYLGLLLILALLIAASLGAYYLWQQQQAALEESRLQLSSMQQQINELQNASTRLSQSINQNQQASSQLQSQLQARMDELNELAQRAISISSRSQRDWMLNEVDYLIRIAHRRLQIARDINSAIAALQAADQRLHDLGDMNLFNLRKQLATDIATLKALHQVDVNGTALALDQIILHVHELPFKTTQDEIRAQLDETKPVPVEPTAEPGIMDSILNTMISIGDIKVHKGAVKPASSEQQQLQIEQLLQTHLLSARLAVLRYDQLQFSHDLEQSQQLLHLHYKSDDNRVQQMQRDLAGFATLVLNPELPELTTSWSLLRKTLQNSKPAAKPDNTRKSPPAATPNNTKAEVL